MHKYKAKINSTLLFEVTEESFEEACQINPNLKQNNSRYGVCPSCDGPVQLIGMYKAGGHTAYARHTPNSIPHVATRTIATNYCPYNTHVIEVNPETRLVKVTNHSVQMFRLIRDYYDKIVYILRQECGYYISKEKAVDIVKSIRDSEMWLYPKMDEGNLPWCILYLIMIEPLFGKWLKKDSDIAIALEKEGVILEETNNPKYVRIGKQSKYFDWNYYYTKHRQTVDEADNLTDTFEELILEPAEEKPICHYKRKVEVDRNWFPNLINSEKALAYRDEELLKKVEEILGEEPITNEET